MSGLANRSEHNFDRGDSFMTVRPGCAVKDENGRVLWRAGDEVDRKHPAYRANAHRCVWMSRRTYTDLTGSKPKKKVRRKAK